MQWVEAAPLCQAVGLHLPRLPDHLFRDGSANCDQFPLLIFLRFQDEMAERRACGVFTLYLQKGSNNE
jgi:hypothetical protein